MQLKLKDGTGGAEILSLRNEFHILTTRLSKYRNRKTKNICCIIEQWCFISFVELLRVYRQQTSAISRWPYITL